MFMCVSELTSFFFHFFSINFVSKLYLNGVSFVGVYKRAYLFGGVQKFRKTGKFWITSTPWNSIQFKRVQTQNTSKTNRCIFSPSLFSLALTLSVTTFISTHSGENFTLQKVDSVSIQLREVQRERQFLQ